MEAWEGGEDTFRGGSGPLHVRRSRYHDPLVDAYLAAAQSCGHTLVDDYNSAKQEGFSLIQSTIHQGRRVSAATAYLHPALKRKNLTVQVSALATRVLFDGRRASALEFFKDGT